MKRAGIAVCMAAMIAVTATALEPLDEGVEPGRFTQDYDAALEYAAGNELPVFLNFTGSDWCGWCQLMDRQVFSKDGWSDYASGKVVLVTLDYPRDESIVPEEYRARNQELQQQFQVRGYPTYVVLDADGTTELGRLGAGRDKTPESFVEEMKEVLRYSDAYLQGFLELLSGEEREAFSDALTSLRELRSAEGDNETQKRELRSRIDLAFQQYLLDRLSAAEKEQYTNAQSAYIEAAGELNEWLAGKPKRSEENDRIYAGFRSRLDEAQETIRGLEATYLP